MGARAAQRPHRRGKPPFRRPAPERHEILAGLRGGSQQLAGVERRPDPTEALPERRQHPDGDVAETRIVLERAAQLGPGDARTLDVHQEGARAHPERDELKRGPAVPGAEDVGAEGRQMIANRVARLALVVDQDHRMAMPAHSSRA
jgi:hypothetical protein